MDFPDRILDKIDLLIYFSPISAIGWMMLSIAARFCNWHRMAILVPIIGVATGVIIERIEYEGLTVDYANITALISLSLLTIYSGIKVLWKKG